MSVAYSEDWNVHSGCPRVTPLLPMTTVIGNTAGWGTVYLLKLSDSLNFRWNERKEWLTKFLSKWMDWVTHWVFVGMEYPLYCPLCRSGDRHVTTNSMPCSSARGNRLCEIKMYKFIILLLFFTKSRTFLQCHLQPCLKFTKWRYKKRFQCF